MILTSKPLIPNIRWLTTLSTRWGAIWRPFVQPDSDSRWYGSKWDSNGITTSLGDDRFDVCIQMLPHDTWIHMTVCCHMTGLVWGELIIIVNLLPLPSMGSYWYPVRYWYVSKEQTCSEAVRRHCDFWDHGLWGCNDAFPKGLNGHSWRLRRSNLRSP